MVISREWPSECKCGFSGRIYGKTEALPLDCPRCGAKTTLIDNRIERAPGVVGDSFPGGSYMDVPHAVCHADGTPRRFYSKTDLKKALNKAGYTISGDTPKPYKV